MSHSSRSSYMKTLSEAHMQISQHVNSGREHSIRGQLQNGCPTIHLCVPPCSGDFCTNGKARLQVLLRMLWQQVLFWRCSFLLQTMASAEKVKGKPWSRNSRMQRVAW